MQVYAEFAVFLWAEHRNLMFGPTLVNKTTNWNIRTLYIAEQMHEMVLIFN